MNPQTGPPVAYNSSVGGNRSAIITIILALLLVVSIVFGGWAFSKMQNYKNNADKIAATAVAAAEKTQAAKLQAEFAELSKSPNKQFLGSTTYGSISFNYPKTWSGYVDTSATNQPINAYFAPNVVPSPQSKTAYALRVELISTDYATVVQQISQRVANSKNAITAQAYLPPSLKDVSNVQAGTLFSGALNQSDTSQYDTLLAIKVRDKTLQISTQSKDYLNDFSNIVLASLKFAP